MSRCFAGKAVGVLTNVPGPAEPMTPAGTDVEGIVGWAPCSGRQAITMRVFTYAGQVRFGSARTASRSRPGGIGRRVGRGVRRGRPVIR
ncbi:WS/DGAT domain-containing protein [Amycolatopsis sp. NPDC004368]